MHALHNRIVTQPLRAVGFGSVSQLSESLIAARDLDFRNPGTVEKSGRNPLKWNNLARCIGGCWALLKQASCATLWGPLNG